MLLFVTLLYLEIFEDVFSYYWSVDVRVMVIAVEAEGWI